MRQIVTRGIVLSRTDFGEADRILTILTPDHGKLRLVAKGVRRIKSKLAGGIELFSISDLNYIVGKRDLGTLVSARMDIHFGNIIKDITRVQLGYELIKLINKNTEDEPEADYFHILTNAFQALDGDAPPELIQVWAVAQLLKIGGHAPNLQSDTAGAKLDAAAVYNFDPDAMAFAAHSAGRFAANDIKFLRLLFGSDSATQLRNISGLSGHLAATMPLVNLWQQQYIR